MRNIFLPQKVSTIQPFLPTHHDAVSISSSLSALCSGVDRLSPASHIAIPLVVHSLTVV